MSIVYTKYLSLMAVLLEARLALKYSETTEAALLLELDILCGRMSIEEHNAINDIMRSLKTGELSQQTFIEQYT